MGARVWSEGQRKEVSRLYSDDGWTLRRIAGAFGVDHHQIRRLLASMGIAVTLDGRKRPPMSDEHKRKIGDRSRGRVPKNKGVKVGEDVKRTRTSIA